MSQKMINFTEKKSNHGTGRTEETYVLKGIFGGA